MKVILLLLATIPLLAQKPHELCAVCHGETVTDFLSHPHSKKGLNCAACHGDSVRHRTSQGHTEPDRVAVPHEIPELCGACHMGKEPKSIRAQYSESKHGKLVLEQSKVRAPHCATCHGTHSVRQEKAVERQCRQCHASLPASCSAKPARAAAVSCAGCHNPHSLLTK